METKAQKINAEIIESLSRINEVIVSYERDKFIETQVIKELKKISKRLDRLSPIINQSNPKSKTWKLDTTQ